MTWVLAIAAAWVGVAAFLAVLIGRGIRLADLKQAAEVAGAGDVPNFVVDTNLPAEPETAPDAVVEPAPETPSAAADTTAGRPRPAIPATRPPVLGSCVPQSERAAASRRADRS